MIDARKHLVQLDMDSALVKHGYLSCSRPGLARWPYVGMAYLVEPELINESIFLDGCEQNSGCEHVCILGME